jgi:hypothetical protein
MLFLSKRLNSAVSLCAAVLAFGFMAVSSQATTWNETADGGGDAGNAPIGSAQVTAGAGALTSITGEMDWFNLGDHADAFVIRVTDPAAFFASTDPSVGGSFIDDGGFEDDSRLYLFDDVGNLVFANDDAPPAAGGSLESYLSDPSTWPGVLVNSPGSVAAGQLYTLVVTYFSNDVLDAAGTPIADFGSDFDALHGFNPAATGIASWEDPGDFDSGWTYTIVLGGATYAVPEPSSALLLSAFAGGGALRRRRRS